LRLRQQRRIGAGKPNCLFVQCEALEILHLVARLAITQNMFIHYDVNHICVGLRRH
jgi:hypothetical protein